MKTTIYTEMDQINGPHQGQPVLLSGPAPAEANAVMILLHGRGAGAQDILSLAQEFERENVAYLAPHAQKATWYPNSFLAPIAQNEPNLSSAMALTNALIDHVLEQGIMQEKIILLGFSQGACLSATVAARKGGRFGGLVVLSGGLIGPAGEKWNSSPGLAGTPAFLGCSNIDPHIPLWRVQETTAFLREAGAEVDERIYDGMGHTVIQDEIDVVNQLLDAIP